MSYRVYFSLMFLISCLGAGFTQTQSSAENQKQTIRVGIAATMNRSNRQIIPTWERDQLVRELQRLRNERKSTIVIEAVALEATAREDAHAEAEKKSCQYFVLTTLLNPSRGPGISGGPDGSPRGACAHRKHKSQQDSGHELHDCRSWYCSNCGRRHLQCAGSGRQ